MIDGIFLQTIEGLGETPLPQSSGQIWEWLQGEKEEITGELLADGPLCHTAVSGVQEAEASVECERDIGWHHRSQMEARLREVIDAQDRLMGGAYGYCAECGAEIGGQRLAADPAANRCIACQRKVEGEAVFVTL